MGRLFFAAVMNQARRANLISEDHFSVDGTLIEAWASLKSFRPKGDDQPRDNAQGNPGNRWVDFHGETRSNVTDESTANPESLLAKK